MPGIHRVGVLILASAPCLLFGNDFFVATNGTQGGDGTVDNPWSLKVALSHPPSVKPGDVIWVRGGTYMGANVSKLTGSPDAPIVVRAYPGERVTFDGAGLPFSTSVAILRIDGVATWFMDIEITNSSQRRAGDAAVANCNPQRPTTCPTFARAYAVHVYGPYSRLINMVLHDTGQGISAWQQATDSEYYGNIVYNNGWQDTDRGHGHGVYTQNETGTKTFRDNLIFNQYGYNFHAYGTEKARLANFVVEGNTFFNGQFLIGGQAPASNVAVNQNYSYKNVMSFGLDNQSNSNLSFTNNYVASFVELKWWNAVRLFDNIIYPAGQTGQDNSMTINLRPDGVQTDYDINRNQYFEGPGRGGQDFRMVAADQKTARGFAFAGWQSVGYDRNSTYERRPGKRPEGTWAFLRPNIYDPNRATLVLFNWDRQDSLTVDLSGLGMQQGELFELRNVQNYFDEGIAGTYTGDPVQVPMTQWTAAPPNSILPTLRPVTTPDFGAFIILRKGVPADPSAAAAASAANVAASASSRRPRRYLPLRSVSVKPNAALRRKF